MEMQLFLVYRGNFSWIDVDTMPIYELIWYYEKLVDWKNEENKAIENPGQSQSDEGFGEQMNTSILDE